MSDGPQMSPFLEPATIDLDSESLAGRLELEEDGSAWTAIVLVLRHRGRHAGAGAVAGEDVSAQLLDSGAKPFPLESSPTGPLPEIGGGLGVSANARFCFRATGAKPAELVVDYAGRTCRFQVHWPENGSEDEQ